MNHISSILWLLSWPLLIYITYRASLFALKLFEKSLPEEEKMG
ncbi:MAG: hypothetical protein RBT74_09330 [Tenuifilaceae bacterium]|nr:hypothetical protein [Tenuifilaceae bacterium]